MQPIFLLPMLCDGELPLTDARDTEQSIRQAVEVDDACGGTDGAGFTGAGGSDLNARSDEYHTERTSLAHAVAHHVDIARLEDPQRQGPVGKQYCIERE